MAIQVNTRIDEADWDRVVAAMPGISNAERMAELVRQQLALLESRRQLPDALALTERLLAPSLQALREQGVRGKGSEIAETLAQTVSEMAAVLLSHSDTLREAPERALAELEALLVQRWARATIHVLRGAALEPASVRNHQAAAPEIRRVFEQVRILSQATAPSSKNAGAATPSPPSS